MMCDIPINQYSLFTGHMSYLQMPPTCRYAAAPGGCKYGSLCRYSHVRATPTMVRSGQVRGVMGPPPRQALGPTSRPWTGNADLVRLSAALEMDYDSLCRLDDVAVGVPPAALRRLPVMARAPVGSSCPICLGDYDWLDDVARLPCGHTYHHECVLTWLAKSKFCCVCKKEVTEAAIVAAI